MTELRVVHGGTPTDAEHAALVAALTSRREAQRAIESPARRIPLSPWVASGLVKGTRTKA